MPFRFEDEPPAHVPDWMLTFGDMMSLLLTFFIMLISMSELKSQEKFQAMADSMRQQFGFEMSSMSFVPGWVKPRNPKMAKTVALGRSKKLELNEGGINVLAGPKDAESSRIFRTGTRTEKGGSIFFQDASYELTEEMKRDLQVLALGIRGTSQKIEIRGHSAPHPGVENADFADPLHLAYTRCLKTMQFLVNELKIEPHRLLISVAGANEPMHLGSDSRKLLQNDRVDIYLLDEVVHDNSTAGDIRAQRPTGSARL